MEELMFGILRVCRGKARFHAMQLHPPPPLPLELTPLSQLHALYFKPGFTEREIRGGERGRERGREREGERERGGELAVYS